MATIAEVARRLDLSERHTKTLIDSGVLKHAPSGRHDLDDQTVRYIRHLRKAKQGIEGGGQSTLSDARARKEVAYAEIAERENNVAKGQWVLFEDVVRACRAQALVSREILLTLIGQIGALLGPEAEGAAQDAVYDALNEMANPFSDKQREAARSVGPIFDREEFNEKKFDEDKKLFDELRKQGRSIEQAAEYVVSEHRRADDKGKRRDA
jgi:uncharacterized Zn finger protein